jgi:alkylation response protein AidB-like acyl-CoA dehydrogenase
MSAIGRTLSVLNRVAGSEFIDRMGLRKTAQALTYRAARDGIALGNAAARRFKAVTERAQPGRLEVAKGNDRFDLNATEEQEMIRQSAARLAKEHLRPAATAADVACAPSAETLATLAELSLAQYAIPEALGGVGTERSPLTTIIVAEALAHGDMGLAVAGLSSVGVVNALVGWGSGGQQSAYLPAFLSETAPVATFAMAEPHPLFDPFTLRTRARKDGDDFVLTGAKALVPHAERAELLLVSAALAGDVPALFLVERAAPGISTRAAPGMGVRAAGLGCVELSEVRVPKSALLGEEAGAPYQSIVDLSRIAWCALATGTAQAVLEYVIEYCNDRVAFGAPISHRQAVAFMIANIGIELEGMRLMTQRAASRAEQGLPFHREAYLARLFCTEKAMEIGTNGVQLLGGHGFIKDHPVERWYRDLRAIGVMEGGLVA